MSTKTVDELRSECRARGLKGFSRLRKAELVALLEGRTVERPKAETVASLKAKCKAMGLRGYSKLTKAALLALVDKHTPKPETDDQAIVRRQSEMSSSHEDAVAMYYLMANVTSKAAVALVDARRLKAIESLRDDHDRTSARWEAWHVRYINEGSGCFAG